MDIKRDKYLNVASAIGLLTNPPKIEVTFKSAIQSAISLNIIKQYIEYLEDAFIINKANRYNIKGRKYIGTPLKYYFENVRVVEKRGTNKALTIGNCENDRKVGIGFLVNLCYNIVI